MPTTTAHATRLSHVSVGYLVSLICLAMTVGCEPSHAASNDPLTVEIKIPLGEVSGRIDHLAFDPGRQRAYVAELGNNSIGIVDLKAKRVIRTVPGFDEPQGEPTTDTLYVANGGDGSGRGTQVLTTPVHHACSWIPSFPHLYH